MTHQLVLASASPFRRMLLENAGIAFTWQAAEIDERALEAPLEAEGASPERVATVLAEAKAESVASASRKGQGVEEGTGLVVIGSDQTMSLGGRVFHKPASREEAHDHLRALSGRTHQLNSAIALHQDGRTVWSHVSTARLTMRPLDDGFIARHLERVGEKALTSVGAYQLEGEGIQLFEAIDGDYFTILGLPILPLLAELRRLSVIDA
ncbi:MULTISPECIES: Maf-like protein [unclassified Rhizobium]|uniref:Maf-like protein n=1 Tax=Rhizobium sp. PP-CC-3G-465 TaxID=2135648 RepID=UPI0010468FF5|nr:septum formation protein [Rhizobium sp. PP-CC-2G-626]TCQ25137.1 septum formation protein [Rhizobium sp. PP-CC-3G-465]